MSPEAQARLHENEVRSEDCDRAGGGLPSEAHGGAAGVEAADPAVRSGKGADYDKLLMIGAVVRRRCGGAPGNFAVKVCSNLTGPDLRIMRLPVAFSSLTLLAAALAAAQTPPPTAEPEGSRTFCEQSVSYRITDPATVPEPYRRFLGPWSDAAWDPNTCAALIVENVDPNGTVSIIYVYGPLSSSARVPGGVLHGTGVIRDGELRFQNSDGTQFAFRPGIVDLVGRMTTPNGQSYESAFKKTP
jgi:hypothetical protein